MINNKILILSLVALLILVVLIIIFYPIIKSLMSENFSNASGYGLNSRFGKINTLVPLNLINKSTDFKLFSLLSQVKFSFVKPPSLYKITGTKEGIISKLNNKSKNIILFPGQSDYILKQNNMQVWPKNIQNIDNNKPAVIHENNEGHFNTLITLLESLNYKNSNKLNTITYDFRNINFNNIYNQFINFLKNDTIIIAYDFGAVIANICINHIPHTPKGILIRNKISKLLLICPTIGGIPMTLRDYFSGNGLLNVDSIKEYNSILLSMPNDILYDYPIAIYNSISYRARNIDSLMKEENKPVDLYISLRNFQKKSLNNPNVDTIIITSDQFNTPICYNFKNDLKQSPERYNSINNNQQPVTDIQYNGTFEGLQTKGDKIVPISTIYKLKELWGDNCKIELIKDKDHFTILKSYELALIILSNL